MRPKTFCVGLHKSGTTSLHAFFTMLKFRSTHTTVWSRMPLPVGTLSRHDAFSDGGGHFWDETLEFGSNHELRALRAMFPDCRFVLQYRPMRPWLISKMLHAGWRKDTAIVRTSGALTHQSWRETSLEVIYGWVENRLRYHRVASDYLASLGDDVLCVDVTSDPDAAPRLADFVIGPGSYRIVGQVGKPLRAFNRLRPTFAPAAMPRANAARAGAEDKARCAAIADSVLKDFAGRPDLDAPPLALRTVAPV